MTPLQINMLLHFYISIEDFPNIEMPAQQEALQFFKDNDLIFAKVDQKDKVNFILTEKGKVYIDLLLNTPLPIHRWVDPRQTSQSDSD